MTSVGSPVPPYFLATLPDACRDSARETWPCTSGNDETCEPLPTNRSGVGMLSAKDPAHAEAKAKDTGARGVASALEATKGAEVVAT